MLKNILITSAGKRVVLVEIFQKTAKQNGVDAKIYTTDMEPEMAPACKVSDGCFVVPRCTSEDYLQVLQTICMEHQVGIVIPTIDTELLVLSANRDIFAKLGICIVVPDYDFVLTCRDKRRTAEFFMQHCIGIPEPIDKHHPIFPMFAKPFDGSASINTHIIKNEKELTEDLLSDPKLIFMECIDRSEYKEYTVDMYYGMDNRVKSIVPRERLVVRAGEINKGITRKNFIVEFLKERMGELKGVRGCICLQMFYRERDHDIKAIEINPRFGGGYPLSYGAGANYAEYIIKEYLLGETIDYSDDWLDHTLMLRYDNDVIVYDDER